MTAVEWLHNTWGNYPDLCTWEKIQEWFEQAKEMEEDKEFELKAYWYGRGIRAKQVDKIYEMAPKREK